MPREKLFAKSMRMSGEDGTGFENRQPYLSRCQGSVENLWPCKPSEHMQV